MGHYRAGAQVKFQTPNFTWGGGEMFKKFFSLFHGSNAP